MILLRHHLEDGRGCEMPDEDIGVEDAEQVTPEEETDATEESSDSEPEAEEEPEVDEESSGESSEDPDDESTE